MTDAAEQADAELLARVAAERSSARKEMEEFYRRHVRYLYAVTRKQCATLGFSQHETEDLVHDAFQRAFARSHTFRAPPNVLPDAARRWTRAWLGRITRNLILDALGNKRELPASDWLERTIEELTPPSSHNNPRLKALRDAILSLSEREQDVLRVSAMYYRAGESHQRLPNDVAAELARRWGTTNDNVRAIRTRALRKVKLLTQELLSQTSL